MRVLMAGRTCAAVIAAAAALLIAAPPAHAQPLDRVVARLNEDILTESDLEERLRDADLLRGPRTTAWMDQLTSEALESVLDRTVLVQAAKKDRIAPDAADVQEKVEAIVAEVRGKFPSEREFFAELQRDHESLEAFKEDLRRRISRDQQVLAVVSSRFAVTEVDAARYANEERAAGRDAESWALRRLALEVGGAPGRTRDEALRALRNLLIRIQGEGLAFDDAIRRYSEDPGAALDGGDLGYLSAGKLTDEVKAALKGLEPGQISEPIVVGSWACVFYVENHRTARSFLFEKRFREERETLLREMRSKSRLELFDERLEQLLTPEWRRCLAQRTWMAGGGAASDNATTAAAGSAAPASAPEPPPDAAPRRTFRERMFPRTGNGSAGP